MAAAVLHLNTETSWRGGESQTLHLASGLARRGHRTIVACPAASELARRAAAAGVEVAPFESRGDWDLPAARRLAALLRRSSPDILHLHTGHAVALGTFASFLLEAPPLVASRRVSFPLHGGPLGRLKYSLRVARVIAVSESIRLSLIERGLAAERVVTVHSGIDPGRFARGDRWTTRAEWTAAAGWPEDAFVIATASHLATHKGVDLFLAAAARAARERPEARFLVIGRGEREADLKRQAREAGMAACVHFAGFRDDMPDVLAGADLFVLASRSGEGSPAVLKEAMAAGLPVVASALDGVREIIEDGRHGLLTTPGHVEDLTRAIVLLTGDGALRARLGDGGRERVALFTLDRMVERTAAVYESLEARA